MATINLTERAVVAIEPGAKHQLFWDARLRGFGVRVYPSGARVYVVQWKRGGRTRQVVLGRHPLTKAEEARRKATAALAAVAEGRDPAAERDAARGSPTLAEVCDVWLVAGVGPKGKPKRASTLAMDRSRIGAHIKPHPIGQVRVSNLTAADIRSWLADVTRGATALDQKVEGRARARRIVRGGAGVAARSLRMLKAVLAHAQREGLITTNPGTGVMAAEDGERERFLSPAELAALGEALEAAERAGEAWQAVACVRLILATGMRKHEALGLRWAEVDLERRRAVLPETKTGRSVRPLSREAVAIISGLKGRSSGEWVFPATHGTGHYTGLQQVWVKVRSAAGLPDVRLHDLRHSFAAGAAGSGASLLVIGRLLGHRKARSTERYAHFAEQHIAEAADAVAQQIVVDMAGRKVRA